MQGVFYRESARKEAVRLGVRGWVQNNSDGSVEAMVTGEEEKTKEFIEWCRKGPILARVADVIVTEVKEQEFEGFQVFR